MFYTAKSENGSGDFVSVGLREGRVVYRFDVGGGVVEIESQYKVDMGEWHTVELKRMQNEGMLHRRDGNFESRSFVDYPS